MPVLSPSHPRQQHIYVQRHEQPAVTTTTQPPHPLEKRDCPAYSLGTFDCIQLLNGDQQDACLELTLTRRGKLPHH
jgi:hypothetical protein